MLVTTPDLPSEPARPQPAPENQKPKLQTPFLCDATSEVVLAGSARIELHDHVDPASSAILARARPDPLEAGALVELDQALATDEGDALPEPGVLDALGPAAQQHAAESFPTEVGVHAQRVQAYGLAFLVVARGRIKLVLGAPVRGEAHRGIGDDVSRRLCGYDVAHQDPLAIRVRRVRRREVAGLEELAQRVADGGIGRGEEAGAQLAARRQAIRKLGLVSSGGEDTGGKGRQTFSRDAASLGSNAACSSQSQSSRSAWLSSRA